MSRNLALALSGIALTVLTAGMVTLIIWHTAPPVRSTALITIGGHAIEAELAVTETQQRRGLSGRTELADDQGMVFIYPQPRIVSFWMHEMLIPIDIIWISGDEVTGIVKSAPVPRHGQRPATFTSPGPVTAVLEVSAGLSDQLGLSTGSPVTIHQD